MKYCFDIDGTICTNSFGQYKNALPNLFVISQINSLYDSGHEIHFYTARGSTTGTDWTQFTQTQLAEWGVKYHSLTLGKPEADIYIDDKGLQAGVWQTQISNSPLYSGDILFDLVEASAVSSQGLAVANTLKLLGNRMCTVLRNGGTIYWCGNGGSASDAQHLAAELIGRYSKNRGPLASISLNTDTSVLTALANDFGYETVFSRQIEALGKPGDMLIGISTSGTSRNVVEALSIARKMQITTTLLSGLRTDIGDLPQVDYLLLAPSKTVARIQETHITWGQILCGYIENQMFPAAPSAH
jgi:D-sedoheptulose 7-phosphate isomerase